MSRPGHLRSLPSSSSIPQTSQSAASINNHNQQDHGALSENQRPEMSQTSRGGDGNNDNSSMPQLPPATATTATTATTRSLPSAHGYPPHNQQRHPAAAIPLRQQNAQQFLGQKQTQAAAVIGPRIMGIKKPTFYTIISVGLFFLLAAVALGLGLGLGLDSSRSSSSTPTTLPPATVTTTPTTTIASPTPSFTGQLNPGPSVFCPQDNKTVYISFPESKPFNIQCGRDYNSAGGAVDIQDFDTGVDNFADCLDICGGWEGCVGAGWGDYGGKSTCWLKRELGKPNWDDLWSFATLQGYVGSENKTDEGEA